MARRGIREYDTKRLLGKYLLPGYGSELVLVGPGDDLMKLAEANPWLSEKQLAAKPDQLFGKRGKHGLICTNLDLSHTSDWISRKIGTSVTIDGITGALTHFLVEPFVAHDDEFYVALRTELERDVMYISPTGGVDIEDNWESVEGIEIPEGSVLDTKMLDGRLREMFPRENSQTMVDFLWRLYNFFVNNHFTYLEINPFTIVDGRLIPLDAVAKVDDTASFECRTTWGAFDFPAPFGRIVSKEEAFIEKLDSKTGASLKLSVLKPDARIWTMVAGGGASVIFADTISDLGHGHELANYGEYSGGPSQEQTHLYARTILDLMTRRKDPEGRSKLLFIGGGIANFTDVASTFTGIIQAITEFKDEIKDTPVEIYVRRGGPNYRRGLERMKALGEELDIPIHVHGPDTHMTNIVSMALAQGE